MLRSRALGAGICLGLSTLTGCAPWPPPRGACIEAFRNHSKSRPWRYEIQGTTVSRAYVEELAGDTPEGRALVTNSRRYETAGFAMTITGAATTVGSEMTIALSGNPFAGLLLVPAIGTLVAGVTLALARDEPFRRAVLAYDARVARDGTCPRPPAPPRPPPPATPPRAVPDEEVLHPPYGPPPLGP